MRTLPDSALEDAKANLARFTIIGIQERFAESLALFQRRLGIGLAPAWNRHVSGDRPSVEELDEDDRALIEEHNRLDVELYHFARELFDEGMSRAPAGFSADVEALEAANRGVNAAHDGEVEAAAEWINRRLPPDAGKLDDETREAAEAAGISGALLRRARRLAKDRRLIPA